MMNDIRPADTQGLAFLSAMYTTDFDGVHGVKGSVAGEHKSVN